MDVGLFLLVNLVSIPFMCEAEALGVRSGRFPRIIDLLKFKISRSERWFLGYCVFFLIFFIIVMAPSASGKSHDAGALLIFLVLLAQVLLWVFVVYRIRNSN